MYLAYFYRKKKKKLLCMYFPQFIRDFSSFDITFNK